MNKEKLVLKKHLSFTEIENYVDLVSKGYFIYDNEEKIYAPAHSEIYLYLGFCSYCLNGLVSEKTGDAFFEDILNDEELLHLFDKERHSPVITKVEYLARETAVFERQRLLRLTDPVHTKINAILEKELENKDKESKILLKYHELIEKQKQHNDYLKKVEDLMSPEDTAKLNKMMADQHLTLEEAAGTIFKQVIKDET